MANIQETNINAYKAEALNAVSEAKAAQNKAESAIKAYVEKGGNRTDIVPESKVPVKKEEPKPKEDKSDEPKKVNSVGVKKSDLLAIAKKENVEGVDDKSSNKDIANAINDKRGVK